MKYVLLSFVVCCVAVTSLGKANANPAVNGITVSPAIEQLTLEPNQNSTTFQTQVTNNTASPVVLQVSAEDFTALNQNGGLSFFNGGAIDTNNPHGLLDFLSIGLSEIALGPRQSQTVPITILNANQLAVGGHYAALMFKVEGTSNGKGNKIIINQAVSSLIFLSTYGQGSQTTVLTTPITGRLLTSFPQTINMVFSNTGNTQTTPRGYVQILDSSSHVVSQGQLNINSNLILPTSSRLFALNLTQLKKHLWPGIYRLKVYYQHDGQATYSVYQQKFLYVNGGLVVLAVVVVIALLVLAARVFLPESLYTVKKRP
jgi:hypothetical protein